jgi:mRNA-degrading endonuclease RelE of RelBE toxin-antitoxin system
VPSFEIEIRRLAQRQIRGIALAILAYELMQAILHLADDPRPEGSLPVAGLSSGYTYRVGGYTIFYAIDDARRRVIVYSVT